MPNEEIVMPDEESTLSDSGESAISDYQSAISDEGNTSKPVFGPHVARAELPHPLGKLIRLRIKLDGMRGLPKTDTSSEGSDARRSYSVEFYYTSHSDRYSCVWSSKAQEGVKSLRGTVQWNEVLYLECFEFSFIQICIYSSNDKFSTPAATCVSAGELLKQSELCLTDPVSREIVVCTLCLLTSQVLDDADEEDHDAHISSKLRTPNDGFHFGLKAAHSPPPADTMNSLHTILCQIPSLLQAVGQENVVPVNNIFLMQNYTHATYQRSLDSESYHPRVNALISSMVSTMDAILPVAPTYMQQRAECAADILCELYWAAEVMYRLVEDGKSDWEHRNPEAELARLTLILVTPAPTIGASTTSASSSRHTIVNTITKDTLLFVLETIVQSSDAFGPLKSAASGLLYFVTTAEMASSNKKQVRDIYKRIDSLATALRRGTAKGSPLTPEHQEAIKSLADDVAVLNDELNGIVTERKSRFKRFFAAKRHRDALQDVVTQLDNAKMDYMMAMATLNATTIADVHGHVKAITLVLNARPVLAPGTRRADAVEFPFSASRIEEV